ncbi:MULTISPECIES: hypothetical protein [Legionella]|uniref:Uncharacterized protein n=1 Tax=Legionella resiliens TaxID=2905958 RepID=A0ABS8X5Y0_9GAMM|nr:MULTISPECIES: hypothetical protein [unclassified Legionella]MCE0724016.1 hypothetical protein [Legionella sp. 9fVS26]MCE3533169.1 hypothetical protein [Legionella sp. 8cVS16]QLZ69349.1 hypothetical protein FOLKNPGA_02132 [Legionella sp. PC1000]
MRINFSLLRLLHLIEYQKPKGEQCSLELFRRRMNPIELSTCMRHLYLFSSEQIEMHSAQYQEILLNLKKPRLHQKLPQLDILEGSEAYRFLLFWVIGGLNNKKPFDDERILGDLRKICRNYETSISPAKKEAWQQNQAVMHALLADARHLLKLTKNIELPLEEKKILLKAVCDHCTWVREQGFFELTPCIDYSSFLDKHEMVVHLHGILEIVRRKVNIELDKIAEDKAPIFFLFSRSANRLQNKLNQIDTLQALLIDEEPSLKHADGLIHTEGMKMYEGYVG